MDLVTEHDYDIKVVQATGYLDTDTNTFRLTGYNGKTLFNARLEIDSNREVWFYPAKDGVEKISSKDWASSHNYFLKKVQILCSTH